MALLDVEVPLLDTRRFETVLTADGAAQFARTIRRGNELLAGRTFWNVNSTARGGGVAEMLRSLIGYARGAGVDARWVVIEGDPEFFDVTKRLHNRLHGVDDAPLGERERQVYERCCTANAESLAARLRPGDVVLLHDPQTAGMIPRLLETGVPVVWRAHIGLDMPNETARSTWRLPDAVRRGGQRVGVLPSRLCVGGPGSGQDHRDPAVDRRVLAEEPSALVRLDHGGAPRRRPRRRPPPSVPRGVRAARRQHRPGDAGGAHHRGGGDAARFAARRAGLPLGSAEGPARGPRGVRRACARARRAAPRARGAGRVRGRRRPRGCRGAGGDRGRVARAAAESPAPGASGAAADGRRRRERRHRQRAPAACGRRRAEEPRGGLRADGLRGDVEGAAGRGHRRRWHPRPDRGRGHGPAGRPT